MSDDKRNNAEIAEKNSRSHQIKRLTVMEKFDWFNLYGNKVFK